MFCLSKIEIKTQGSHKIDVSESKFYPSETNAQKQSLHKENGEKKLNSTGLKSKSKIKFAQRSMKINLGSILKIHDKNKICTKKLAIKIRLYLSKIKIGIEVCTNFERKSYKNAPS